MQAAEIIDTVAKFTEAFNENDLDRVMAFFSDDAVYEPGDGRIHQGKAEIRAAFEPQFQGSFGVMQFDERDLVIDAENGKAASRWICRHDISQVKGKGPVAAFRKILAGLAFGNRFGWQGVDIFHFNSEGKIKGKFTYGWYGSRPHLERRLG